jgi:hypothetical protein
VEEIHKTQRLLSAARTNPPNLPSSAGSQLTSQQRPVNIYSNLPSPIRTIGVPNTRYQTPRRPTQTTRNAPNPLRSISNIPNTSIETLIRMYSACTYHTTTISIPISTDSAPSDQNRIPDTRSPDPRQPSQDDKLCSKAIVRPGWRECVLPLHDGVQYYRPLVLEPAC